MSGRKTAGFGGVCLFIFLIPAILGQNVTSDVVFEPARLIHVIEGTHHEVMWSTSLPQVTSVKAHVDDVVVAEVVEVSEVSRSAPGGNSTHYGFLNISALFIGYNRVHVTLYDQNDELVGTGTLPMSVLLSYQKLTDIFALTVGIFVAFAYVNMGATMKIEVVKGIVKKPVGPLLGMTCQYIFMPLIAFGLGKVAFPGNVMAQLGMFLTGCSPGGGASNMWTHLLGGSLDLSIMMTFFSTVCAFASIPLWVFAMGSVIMGDTEFIIPYKDIAVLVISLAVPCVIGLLIQRFLPKVAKVLEWLLTPVSVFIIVFIFTFGVYSNIYVFYFFDLTTLLAGFGLPALGYVSGFVMAKIFRQKTEDVIAISIETGIQNASVAIFILKFTLEKPAGDLSVVFPAASAIMTPLPLLVALLVKKVHAFAVKSKSADIAAVEEKAGVETKKMETEEKTKYGAAQKSAQKEGGVDNLGADLQDDAV